MDFMLAREWTGAKDPAGWFMSEKFDGWRCGWDGQRLITREGVPLNPPDWFTAELPDVPLDAEIWGGYGSFQALGRILRAPVAPDRDWRRLSLQILDVHNGNDFFKDTYPALCALPVGHTARVVEQQLCTSQSHLDAFLAQVTARGGEGVVLRHPYSVYEGWLSAGMRKLKPVMDSEGTVIGYKEGRQSLLLRLKSGVEFYLRAAFSPLGTEVTFRHLGFFESGKPREPRFLRVRPSLAA